MSKVISVNGNLVAIADSDADVAAFLKSRFGVELIDVPSVGSNSPVVNVPTVFAQTSPAVPISVPDHCITVKSYSQPGQTYGVAVTKSGYVYACTCKAFEFNNKKPCKHMEDVYWNPPLWLGIRGVDVAKAPAA